MSGITTEGAERSADEKRRKLAELLKRRAAAPKTYPTSFAQQRLWFLAQLEPDSPSYNVPCAWVFRGPLDVDVLRRTVALIHQRHESLRTRFGVVDDVPVQVVDPAPDEVPIEVVELEGDGEAARVADYERRLRAMTLEPVDLANGPLIRWRLFRVSPTHHLLAMVFHHAVFDGWSTAIVTGEMVALYKIFANGDTPVGSAPLQYSDFVAWQRQHVNDAEVARQIAFWSERLRDAPAILELPLDHPRPAVPGAEAGTVSRSVPRAASAGFEALLKAEGATPFMGALALYAAVLSRYAGQERVVIGTPVAGRERKELERVVGYFANTLALPIDLTGAPTFRALLRRVRETALAAYAHQDLPFDRLVDELKVPRSLQHAPVYQVMIASRGGGVTNDDPVKLASGPDGELSMIPALTDIPVASADLTLRFSEYADGLLFELEHRLELWDAPTAARLLDHVETLVAGISADPDLPVATYPLLPEAERRTVMEAFNDTALDHPRPLIHQLFEARAAERPDAVALVHDGAEVTYGALNARANRIAHHLHALGVGPETLVGVCMARTPELVAALFGVLKAGGGYVPLDPAYPAERIANMVDDARAPVVLTESKLAARVPSTGARVVEVDTDGEIAARPETDPEATATDGNTAYIIFTSGSTGRPKGVQIAHRSAVTMIHWLRSELSDEELGGMLGATSISFDVSIAEIFGTLAWGGRLILAENALFLPEVAAHGVVVATMVPSAAAELVRMAAVPTTVRAFNLGGEAVPLALSESLHALGHVETVRNLYGPTEDTTYSTMSRIPRGTERVRVGRPVSNTTAMVLDARLQPVPIGVYGELYLTGGGLARGYLNRPAMTAEKWLPNPHGPAGSRMYRVGDVVRWMADGELDYLGRIDHQVKIRGFRIELGEIEARIQEHPSVRDAVVIVREDDPGFRRVVAYVTPASGATVATDDVKARLKGALPEYMVPSVFVTLAALPLSPNGKVDRRSLPRPEGSVDASVFVAPRTPTETGLAAIWAEVLKVERVGARDSFFELGGHSLIATRVISRIRQAFEVELPMRALFEAPTLEELAHRIDAAGRGDPDVPAMAPAPRDRPLPLSFAQERLWFFDRLVPGSSAYNLPVVAPVDGVDAAVLERALGDLVARHESLRTTFAEVDGRPVQVIGPAGGFRLERVDLSHLPVAEREVEALRRAGEEANRPFDLRNGPLFRATLVDGGDGQLLVLVMHHVCSDGWSMDVLQRELDALYRAAATGAPAALPPMALQYADFAVWQRGWLSGEVLEAQIGYWRGRLEGAPPLLDLPTDRPRPALQTFAGATQTMAVGRRAGEALHALARQEGATPFMVLLAAFSVLLSRYSGQEDVVVGSPIAGRNRVEIEGMIGFFVNSLVLRTDVSGDPTFRQVLRQVRESTLGAYAHQDVPFEKLVEEIATERSLAHSPLFQVMFALQNTSDVGEVDLDAMAAGADVPGMLSSARFDLTVSLFEASGGFGGTLEYNTDLFDAATIRRLGRHFAALAEAAAGAPDVPLSYLALAGRDERARLLQAGNGAARDLPEDATLHGLFAARAARAPDAVALVSPEGETTYGALDARANRLAHRLRALGVGPDVPVAVSVGPSPAMAVAVLAALKAGGAYVLVDPAAPPEERARVLRDCSAPVVLSVSDLVADLLDTPAEIVLLDDASLDGGDAAAPVVPVSPANLAAVAYPSGPAGKAVMVPHRALVNLAITRRESLGITPASRVLLLPSHPEEAFGPLLAGAALHLASPDGVDAALRAGEITLAVLPPAVLVALEADAFPALRAVAAVGGACPVETARRWSAGRTFVNAYGPAEVSPGATAASGEDGARRPAIGRPLPNVRAYVLDGAMAPVPVGIPGELYVGGAGVARGYLGDAAATAERFVPNPFGGEGKRLYRTGDRARWLPGGELDLLGRMDGRAAGAPAAAGAAPHRAAFVAPRTETERRVAEIWCEVLHRESVGATDDFFELGGHSLLATQVVARLRGTMEVDVPLRALFESPTVAAIAALVDGMRAAAEAAPAPPAAPRLGAASREGRRMTRTVGGDGAPTLKGGG